MYKRQILSQATLSDVVPPRKLGTYMGVIGAVFAVSNVLGPLMGGWFEMCIRDSA